MRRASFMRVILFLPVAAAFVLLILRGNTASAAARTGVETCIHSVIPSLLPFMVLTNLLLRLKLPERLLVFPGLLFERLFSIRRTALRAFLAGFVGGYPLGAAAAAECCRLGQCSREEAERLAIFADNCSPGFLFALAGGALPGGLHHALLLLILQWAVSLWLGVILSRGHSPSVSPSAAAKPQRVSLFGKFTASVLSGGRSCLCVCAYVVFFSVFSPFLPEHALLRGSFELTGGILLLHGEKWSPVIAAFLTGFGGLSVACQVFSALEGSGVSAARYLPLRLLHGLLMALGMTVLMLGIPYLLAFAASLLVTSILVKRTGNRSVPAI